MEYHHTAPLGRIALRFIRLDMVSSKQSGERIDGIEAILVWVGFWILVTTGVTWFLYSRKDTAHRASD